MQNIVTAFVNSGQGQNAPHDINEYLGRLVRSYDTVYTVARVEPSTQAIRFMDGTIIPGAARLYIAREEGEDGRPEGRWTEAANIAAPGLSRPRTRPALSGWPAKSRRWPLTGQSARRPAARD